MTQRSMVTSSVHEAVAGRGDPALMPTVPHFGPAPGVSALRASVSCRSTPDHGCAPAVHEVRIETDWSTVVPHDLPAERICIALGGHASCVGLVDRVIPALRVLVGLMLRVDERPLFRPHPAGWVVAEPQSCCLGRTFAGAADAAAHARSTPHMATSQGADWEQLTLMSAAAGRAYGSHFELPTLDDHMWSALAACTRGLGDVEYLFRCGMAPARVVDIHFRSGAEVPLPRSFYLAVAAGELDPSQADAPSLNRSVIHSEHPLDHYVLGRAGQARSRP